MINIKEACRLDSKKITLNYARQYGLFQFAATNVTGFFDVETAYVQSLGLLANSARLAL